ncbi:HEPN domain-containing protein [Thermodesulfovibrio sp. 3907-1M]|uniref:HEPN domain-containing protein n=1 Tax=Thermodesulfovibrio autotrophicus TaxID=3118333 RepID=A0AAU8GXB5_9BACT
MGKELALAEIEIAEEKLEAFLDDRKAKRWANATVNLYFALEHAVKALLASVGIEPKSHEGVKIMFSMHFIKSGAVSPKIGRYLGNLYDRRTTAEYSPLRRSEFTEEEVKAYSEWVKEALLEILPLLNKNKVPADKIKYLIEKI